MRQRSFQVTTKSGEMFLCKELSPDYDIKIRDLAFSVTLYSKLVCAVLVY